MAEYYTVTSETKFLRDVIERASDTKSISENQERYARALVDDIVAPVDFLAHYDLALHPESRESIIAETERMLARKFAFGSIEQDVIKTQKEP